MKRIKLFSLVLLGLILVVSAASSSEAPDAQVAPDGVGVVDLEKELALLAQGGVESTPVTCVLCFADGGVCDGGSFHGGSVRRRGSFGAP